MPLKNFTIVTELKMKEVVKFEAKTNCKNKEWSSFLCILGHSSEKSKKEKLNITDTLLFISESMSLKSKSYKQSRVKFKKVQNNKMLTYFTKDKSWGPVNIFFR